MYLLLEELKNRNETMFYFATLCLLGAVFFLILSLGSNKKVLGINAWHKPFKFSLSIALYAYTVGWLFYYLADFNFFIFNWTIIVLLGFEIVYIAIQANREQLSHYNIKSPLYSFLYMLMALAASGVSLYTAYAGILFFVQDFPFLSPAYVWGIRLGILLFVIFSFEGFLMGSKLRSTAGTKDPGIGIPLLHWSKTTGDLRIAHFIGMHALQILPLLSCTLIKNTSGILLCGFLYLGLAIFVLVQALKEKPLFKANGLNQSPV